MKLNIPGQEPLELAHLVLDYNGTIAEDGKLLPALPPILEDLATRLQIYVITADTFGSVAEECEHLPVSLQILKSNDHSREKELFVRSLSGGVIAIGNGANDCAMVGSADLGIAVIGPEGCALETLLRAKVVVTSIEKGLALLQKPDRLVATLRR
ncbi:haloacid dehalogenase [Heliorestis acidaminivorans]|uniref:Haloacid dehalogenase n=1 Tax=Heliorestis acidaminivorans TaxID=553427 RepID=A0A6I0F0Q7_9FIRM|nr:HAD family hydrolase [Heliorestis acidaminivorans]KAB2954546.1 haloacid dehalogenase [Heliorestis acidaminivorans]